MGNSPDIKNRTYEFALNVIMLLDSLDKKDFVVQIIGKQVLRSSTSIGANVIEAQAGSSTKDFVNYYHYALKSANETQFWLKLLKDSRKLDKSIIEPMVDECLQISKILGAIIVKIKNKS